MCRSFSYFFLIILGFDCKIRLWMVAYRTFFRRLFPNMDMTAVCTFPDNNIAFFKDFIIFYIVKQGKESFLVSLFNITNRFK